MVVEVAAAQRPSGDGGGGESLPPALEQLRNNPMFGQIAAAAAQNPQVLAQMLPALAQSNPEILEAVQANPEAFQRMLAEAATAQRPGGAGGGEHVVRLTEAEGEAVAR